jgi:hypothetical protein
MSIFIQNKYNLWYHSLIEKATKDSRCKTKGYFEEHHIIPKSLGGSNHKYNLVLLTPREHYIAHHLLVRMLSHTEKYKMVRALTRFKEVAKSSRSYEFYKKTLSNHSKGKNNSSYGKRWYHNPISKEKFFIHYNKKEHSCLVPGLPEQQGGILRDKNYIWINNGFKESMISQSEIIPNGWKKGRLRRPNKEHLKSMARKRHTAEKDKEHSKKLKNRITVINPKNNVKKRIYMNDLKNYLKSGYILPTECIIDGMYFESFTLAGKYFKLPQSVVKSRVKSKKWMTWNYAHNKLN